MGDSEIGDWARLDAKQLFSSAGAAFQGMRLRIEKEDVVFVEDLHTLFREAGPLFQDRRFREAYTKCDHVCRELEKRINRWERAAETRLRAIKNRNKPEKLEQLRTEIANVKRQSQGAFRLLSRLRDALQIMAADRLSAPGDTGTDVKTCGPGEDQAAGLADSPEDQDGPASAPRR